MLYESEQRARCRGDVGMHSYTDKKLQGALLITLILFSSSGCINRSSFFGLFKKNNTQGQVFTPEVQGPVIDAGSIPPSTGKQVTLSNGAEIFVQNREGVLYYLAEGTFTREGFQKVLQSTGAGFAHRSKEEKRVLIARELGKVFAKLKEVQAIEVNQIPEVGYFSFEIPYEPDLLASVKSLNFSHSIAVSPVAFKPNELESIRALSQEVEVMAMRPGPRDSTRALSGLDRIKAPEFVAQAQKDIGGDVEVNGSRVRVGVTDTGVTLNHPTFKGSDPTQVRIAYMKDFTKEGRVYFNKSAKFEVSIPSTGSAEDLEINAEIISTPPLPLRPAGDQLTAVDHLKIKVSSELKKILTTPGSGAKLGILKEEVFQSKGEAVDINGDGKTDSGLYVILIPGAKPEDDVVYVDPFGTGDFRDSKPVGDWNKTKTTWSAYAEKIGFDFREENLLQKNGKDKVAVRSISIVGFDPGGHGTHVSGIIAGKKTLSNDDAQTLARGVAPEATLLVNRVCANRMGCSATEALVDLALNGGVDVINMSLGGLSAFNDGFGVQELLIDRVSSLANVLFIVSAGNSGPGRQTVGSPSTARSALSIGATATAEMIQRQYQWTGTGGASGGSSSFDSDFMLFFSSRGPTAAGGFKPNVSAPGTEMSSVPLNVAPGGRGGVDVYWGTSMAAPTAAGAYALLLDGIRKYNQKNPLRPLTTQASVLREVLIQTARPFDMNRFDPLSGERLTGQYTWIDEGTGMIDLVAAWKKLFELRDQVLPTAVSYHGIPVELEYPIYVSMKAPNGNSYDGSTARPQGSPVFGNGIYLNYSDLDSFKQVNIGRRLPEYLSSGQWAGDLMVQLRTSRDEFILKTVIYGSDQVWLKAGVTDQLNCEDAEVANLSIFGDGGTIEVAEDGKSGTVNAYGASALNVCFNRRMIREILTPGDHGALIMGYRTVDGEVASLPSFTVPVYITVPHKVLSNSTAYEVEDEVGSFGVRRNYVKIPEGTTLVKVTLEVPQLKGDENGVLLPGSSCSGVELMALTGSNTSKPFQSRQEARIYNCDAQGRWKGTTVSGKNKLSFSSFNPTPGIWDLPVFGSYKFPKSKFKLRVDYVVAETNTKEIKGGLDALNGSLKLQVKESSLNLIPNSAMSRLEINGLQSESQSKFKVDAPTFIPGSSGVFRTYSKEIKKVRVATGKSPGNDIDLFILECAADADSPEHSSCTEVAESTGPTDEELVRFSPKSDKKYVVRVEYSDHKGDVKNDANFTLTETLVFDSERLPLVIEGENGNYEIQFTFPSALQAQSKLLAHPFFVGSGYKLVGQLSIKSADETLLNETPVLVGKISAAEVESDQPEKAGISSSSGASVSSF